MFQKRRRKFFGGLGDRQASHMVRIRTTRSMTKKNRGEGTRPGWLPEESLETQFSARNNDGFGSDGYLLVNGERRRRQYKQERQCSDSQQLSLDIVIGAAVTS
jgi:predicted N-acyltransferase